MREHTKGVVTACKGGHDYQPLAVSYTIRLPLSLPQICTYLQTRASCLSRFFNMASSLDLCNLWDKLSFFSPFIYCKACAFFV